jgi:ABC-type multidrug transport system fused ATPase/permease subunit
MDLYARSERMFASAHRVLEFIEQKPSIQDRGEHTVTKAGFDLVFENVSFGYGRDRFVLRDIELGIRTGEMVAIVGESGSGKSSLARLMVRLADPVCGSVCLGGRKAQEYTLAALRTLVCYVPQAPVLFRGTIRDNLLCARPSATPGQIEDAIQAVCLASVIERLAQGIDQPLESGGSGLSGGEQQRLAIARALLRDSAVLILDEATSALDVPTERAVLKGIRRLRPNCTFVVISHRVSSLRSVERFIVLERGAIASEGDFLTLQVRSRLFRSMLDVRIADADAPISLTERVAVYGERRGREGDFGGTAM